MIRSIRRAKSLQGTVSLPGDKSISHRYAMLAAIAEGQTEIRHFAASQDCRSTLDCLRCLGVEAHAAGDTVTISGRGLRGLAAPGRVLDAGNSGTTMRLLSGILAGQPFATTLSGDESLSRRPMGRIAQPLRLMGADVETRAGDLPPLTIRGGNLKGLRYTLPVASAQVKSCILLAGIYAKGPTAVREDVPTRDHTEIALAQFGGVIRQEGSWIEVEPGPRLTGRRLDVPGDLSGAAFFLAAAALVPGAELVLPRVGLNRRRRELLDYLKSAGMDLTVENQSEDAGEPRGDLRVRHSPGLLSGGLPAIGGGLAASLIDEIPVLAVLGSQTEGGLEISGAGELRVKESDRIAAVAASLAAMGAHAEERPDGLIIRGAQRLRGADIDTRGDHRIAMAFAVAGMAAEGETRIHDAECAAVSYPDFWNTLERIISGRAGRDEILARDPRASEPAVIYVVGFMGVGKTSVGGRLAELLGRRFVDLDQEIEKSAGMPIRSIFLTKGEEWFRAAERAELEKFSSLSNAVVALGGGAICHERNRGTVEATGVSVWLDASIETIYARCAGDKTRPLFTSFSEMGLLLERRRRFYEMARLRVAVGDESVDDLARRIIRLLGLQPTSQK